MFLQDLIKHTPPDHDDYMKLNIALSKLENVAYQLNEKKRASEEKLAAEVILTKLWGSKHVTESVLLRQDDVVEMVRCYSYVNVKLLLFLLSFY